MSVIGPSPVSYFFAHGGSVRLLLTSKCSRTCRFCHSEGQQDVIADSGSPATDEPTREQIKTVAERLCILGARRFYLSGGEPTLRSDLAEIVLDISSLSESPDVTLATNADRVRDHLPKIGPGKLGKIKISVHEIEKSLGARTWDVGDLKDTVRFCRRFALVEFNTLVCKGNWDQIPKILSVAACLSTNVQLLELIWTPETASQYQQEHVDIHPLQDFLVKNGGVVESTDATTVAGHMTAVRWSGIRVRFYDPGKAICHGRICSHCGYKSKCIEGLFAIRFGAGMRASPCLLRGDLGISFSDPSEPQDAFLRRLNDWFTGIAGTEFAVATSTSEQ